MNKIINQFNDLSMIKKEIPTVTDDNIPENMFKTFLLFCLAKFNIIPAKSPNRGGFQSMSSSKRQINVRDYFEGFF